MASKSTPKKHKMQYFLPKLSREISDCAQMSKTIIAVRHFGLGGRESLETAVRNIKHFPC